MLAFAADENLNGAITRGLFRLRPSLNLVRIQDSEVYTADDPTVLEWCAKQNRILISHDVRTLRKFAEDRILASLPMPGLIEVNEHVPIRTAIDDLVLMDECSESAEWQNRILFLPLR